MKNTDHSAKSSNDSDHPPTDSNVTAIRQTQEFSKGELGQVQEILFGRQQRDNDERLIQLQRLIDQRVNDLSENVDLRFKELGSKLDSTVATLKQQMGEQDDLQSKNHTQVNEELQKTKSTIDERISSTSGLAAQQHQRLDQELNNCRNSFEKSVDQTRSDLTRQLEEAIAELRTQKLDREALSGLLGSIATELSSGSTAGNASRGAGTNKQQKARDS